MCSLVKAICHMRRRIHVCHMRRRIHVCHMRRRIHVLACESHLIQQEHASSAGTQTDRERAREREREGKEGGRRDETAGRESQRGSGEQSPVETRSMPAATLTTPAPGH
jgi:hypothetical protein